MIIVSACLLGINTKYDGSSNEVALLTNLCPQGHIIPVCPEQLGGLNTPRRPCEIVGGNGSDVLAGKAKVISGDGTDFTANFVAGAREVLKIAALFGAKKAILKERSPSCGCNYIYDGSFKGNRIPGSGVTAALLEANNIQVYSEEELNNLNDLVTFGK